MSKRPLCQMALMFALGVALSRLDGRTPYVILAAAVAGAVVCALYALRKKQFCLSVLLLPVWLYAGMYRCESAAVPQPPYEHKERAQLSGTVYARTDKEDKTVLYLKNLVLEPAADAGHSSDSQQDAKVSYPARCIAYAKGDLDCSIGNTILLNGTISRFEEAANPGQFEQLSYYHSLGIGFSMYQIEILGNDNQTSRIRQTLYGLRWILHKRLDELAGSQASVLQAMLLGEKEMLEAEQKELYQKNGISHILVISGLHFSMIGMCIYRMLRRAGAPFAVAGSAGIVLLFLYGMMTGFGISAVRAWIMFLLAVGAQMLGRGYDMPSALSAAVLFLLVRNPLVLWQSGFQLSVGALLGVILLLPVTEEVLAFPKPKTEQPKTEKSENKKNPMFPIGIIKYLCKTMAEGMRAGIAIQLATFPILLYSFCEFSPYSLLLNCFVLPLLPVVLLGTIAALAVSCISMSAAMAVVQAPVLVLHLYESLCHMAARLPMAVVVSGQPAWWQMAAYYALLGAAAGGVWLCRSKVSGVLRLAGCASFFVLAIGVLLWRDKSGMEVAMLDVGQGQSVYVRCGETDILYDGGSTDVSEVGKYRIAPFLKSQGVGDLELVIVSHMDADHYNGVLQMLEEKLVDIDVLMLSGLDETDEGYIKLTTLAKERGTKVWIAKAGDRFSAQDAVWAVLHPAADYRAADKNDASLVLRLCYGEFSMLLTGDVEAAGEQAMEAAGVLQKTDLLQAAHHGSHSSSSEAFLDAVSPETVLISSGKDNSYGHPHEEVLARLKARGCRIYGTAQSGCLQFRIRN